MGVCILLVQVDQLVPLRGVRARLRGREPGVLLGRFLGSSRVGLPECTARPRRLLQVLASLDPSSLLLSGEVGGPGPPGHGGGLSSD